MPILHKVGRKHISVRLLIGVIYLFLIGGAITMVYPFALMIAGSTKSAVDQKEMRIVPGFLVDETLLYRKYIEGLFNEKLDMVKAAYDESIISFESVEPPADVNEALVGVYAEFLDELGDAHYNFTVGFLREVATRGTMMHLLRELIRDLKVEFDGDLDAANRELQMHSANWQTVFMEPQIPLERVRRISDEPLALRYRTMKQRQPQLYRFYFSVEGMYKNMFLKPQYTKNISEYNTQHGTSFDSYDEIRLPRRVPDAGDLEIEDWERFVREALNLLWIKADAEAVIPYRKFLQAKYLSIEALNRIYETDYAAFESVPLFDDPLQNSIAESDWTAFLRGWKESEHSELHRLPLEMIYIDSLDFMFEDFLAGRYESIEALNGAIGSSFANFEEIRLPQKELHFREFLQNRNSLRREFATRNYKTVIEYMLMNGRALVNTVIYCGLAVLAALIVNPMAAYALSRFQLPSTYKILLFLMVTMAFPPMVTQIPIFLTLRNFNLLNTFWALILPGLANGYLIFILKGFFDSQPKELYECAEIDGANQWVLFWHLTMNLSKPVLAYIALMAFTAAYSNFMFALLICQDERMWTLMPTLYQLQLRSHMGITFASLIIAAIPTFAVFLFAQNIIMRGIVVPVEK